MSRGIRLVIGQRRFATVVRAVDYMPIHLYHSLINVVKKDLPVTRVFMQFPATFDGTNRCVRNPAKSCFFFVLKNLPP